MLRRTSAALRLGEIEFVDSPAPLLIFERAYTTEHVLCIFNMSAEQTSFRHALLKGAVALPLSDDSAEFSGDNLVLPPYGVWLGTIA
jgi:alpha-glucosidase